MAVQRIVNFERSRRSAAELRAFSAEQEVIALRTEVEVLRGAKDVMMLSIKNNGNEGKTIEE